MINWYQKKRILKELQESRPLPLGRREFEAWSDRIIELAQVPGATNESQKFALSEMVLHVKPTQSFESYGYFVHQLRKGAANQVAHTIFQELKEKRNARAKEEQVLADSKVPGATKEVGPEIKSDGVH